MPRKLERALSPRKVQSARPGLHADGGCLYLQVTTAASGGLNRSWIFRYGVPGPDGKTRYRDFGMGSASTFTLAEAREKARQLRQRRYDGVDLVEERRATRATVPVKTVTFAMVSDQWIAAHPEWKVSYGRAHRQRLRDFILPKIGPLSVRSIVTSHVTDVLDQVWLSRPNTGSLVRMMLEQILDFAKTKGHRDGENPARWSNLKAGYAASGKLRAIKRTAEGKGEHHEALPYKDLPGFMVELRALPASVEGAALEFCILNASRTGEVVKAPWSEIDLATRTWSIPAGRMKGKRPHKVPLSDAAVAVLGRMTEVRTDNRVFPGLSERGMRRVFQEKLDKDPLTVHGLRSTFRDWVAEATNFQRELGEAALAHHVGGVEGAYQRGDLFEKRRKMMDAWAAYCGPAAGAKVVPMPKKKQAG